MSGRSIGPDVLGDIRPDYFSNFRTKQNLPTRGKAEREWRSFHFPFSIFQSSHSLSQARLDIHCNSLPSDDCSAISNHRTESESRNLEGGDTKTLDLLLL
ncbi:hypothetical protein ACSBR1_026785 [Camellia fascicularis]